MVVNEIQKSGHCWVSPACPFPRPTDGDSASQTGVGTCLVLLIGAPVTIAGCCFRDVLYCFPSPGPSSAGSLAGQVLREQAQNSYKVIWLAGQEAVVICLVTYIATSPGRRPEMVSCFSGHCSRPE